jgi:hypothetical protein
VRIAYAGEQTMLKHFTIAEMPFALPDLALARRARCFRAIRLAAIGIACASFATAASAGLIRSPVDAAINVGGPGAGAISNTLDQAGLSAGFASGVTDFDAYIASNPTHTFVFPGFEWFSDPGTSAQVTYDLGALYSIDKLALWNEESGGIGLLDLFYSDDGITFSGLASGLLPTDNILAAYRADVFTFGAVNGRYVRFDMSGCSSPFPAVAPRCESARSPSRRAFPSPYPNRALRCCY